MAPLKLFATISIIVLPFLAFGVLGADPVEDPPPLLDIWEFEAKDGCFSSPLGISADGEGHLYVADSSNARIQQFDLDGGFLSKWGKRGQGPSEFNEPRKAAIAPDGNIYVVERYNHRVQRFDRDRNYLGHWGGEGIGPGQLRYPFGIAVSDAGDVYVADMLNHRIQRFDRDGNFIVQWYGFSYPHSVAVDASGFVYVTDNNNHRVRKFTSTGTPVLNWGSRGGGPGQLYYPRGIHAGSDGLIYVADSANRRIQVFDSDGGFVRAFPTRGEDPGRGLVPEDLTTDALGRVHVVADNVLLRYTEQGEFDIQWGCRERTPRPIGITVAFDGRILVTDDQNGQVIVMTPEGERLSQFGSEVLSDPYDVAVAVDGTAYVADYGEYGVWKFPVGGDPELIQDKFDYPWGLSCSDSGDVYVGDYSYGLRRIDPEGNVFDDWFDCEGSPCEPREGYDAAIAPDGTIYTSVYTGDREIWKFDAEGRRLTGWGTYGTGEGEFRDAYGVAVGPDGSVWITDYGNHRVQKFDADGNFLTMWGERGDEPGQFGSPWGIAADRTGKIYVADYDNFRIQIFGFPITHDYFSTDTTQSVRPCDDLMTVFHGAVYGNKNGECEVEPFASFLPFQIGLDAVHVRDTTTLLFSVDEVGHVVVDGNLMTLYPNVLYLYDTETGLITEALNFPAEGIGIDNVNALYEPGSDRWVFTVDRNTSIRFAGKRRTLRACKAYAFDRTAGTLKTEFNGCKIGLTDIDAFHVISGDRFAFSTSTQTYIRLDGQLVHLYPQNGYVYDASTGELEEVFYGAGIGLDDLDGLFLAPGVR